jgi:hypothetical protein
VAYGFSPAFFFVKIHSFKVKRIVRPKIAGIRNWMNSSCRTEFASRQAPSNRAIDVQRMGDIELFPVDDGSRLMGARS